MMQEKRLGKYKLIEQIGRGGYGTVYRARETVLDVERAVKILHPALVSDPEFLQRFLREAKITARLDHPHIVPVYELAEEQGAIYIVMKYMAGGSLKDLLAKEGCLPFERALKIASQVASALDFALDLPEQLIHRDIKPGNILFDANGSACLADFGFAKALTGASSVSLSSSGGIVGTPWYIAPEIWRGQTASPASDVYSLACVFYEMLVGRMLFEGDSPAEVMTKHILEGPKFSDRWPVGTPDGLIKVLQMGLEGSPESRVQKAEVLVERLRELKIIKKIIPSLASTLEQGEILEIDREADDLDKPTRVTRNLKGMLAQKIQLTGKLTSILFLTNIAIICLALVGELSYLLGASGCLFFVIDYDVLGIGLVSLILSLINSFVINDQRRKRRVLKREITILTLFSLLCLFFSLLIC